MKSAMISLAVFLFVAPEVGGLARVSQGQSARIWTKTADRLWEISGVPGRSMSVVIDHAAPGEAIVYGLALGATGDPLSWTMTTYLGRDATGISLEKSSGTVAPGAQCTKSYVNGLKQDAPRESLVLMTVIECHVFGGDSERQGLRLPLPPTSFATTLPAVPLFIPRLVVVLKADGDSGLSVAVKSAVQAP